MFALMRPGLESLKDSSCSAILFHHAALPWLPWLPLALAVALGYVALRTGLLAPDQVTLARVSRGALSPSVFGKCMIEARRRCMVGPMAAGWDLVVKFDVGDVVKAG